VRDPCAIVRDTPGKQRYARSAAVNPEMGSDLELCGNGHVAANMRKRGGRSLQSPVHRFDSGRRLETDVLVRPDFPDGSFPLDRDGGRATSAKRSKPPLRWGPDGPAQPARR
jgi:hypothetical protein